MRLTNHWGHDYEVVKYGVTQGNGGLTLNVIWRPIQPAGPYDMYVHLLDPTGRTIGQSDRLVWPVRDFRYADEGLGPPSRGYFDEGSATNDLLLTRHDVAAPPGSYTLEIGLAQRDPRNPDAVTEGIGSLRLPVRAETKH